MAAANPLFRPDFSISGKDCIDGANAFYERTGRKSTPQDLIPNLLVLFKPVFDKLDMKKLTTLFILMVDTSTKYGDGLAKKVVMELLSWSSKTTNLYNDGLAREFLTPPKTPQLKQIIDAQYTNIMETVPKLHPQKAEPFKPLIECILTYNKDFVPSVSMGYTRINDDEWDYITTNRAFQTRVESQLDVEYNTIKIDRATHRLENKGTIYTLQKLKIAYCWICCNMIYIFGLVPDNGGAVIALTSPGEWEHMIPPGVGNLTGILFPTWNEHVRAMKQVKNNISYIMFAILPSHIFCNQVKNALVFITFLNMMCGIYEEALKEFSERVIKKIREGHGYNDYSYEFRKGGDAAALVQKMMDCIGAKLTPLVQLINRMTTANDASKPEEKKRYNHNNVMLIRTLFNGMYTLKTIIDKLAPPIGAKLDGQLKKLGRKHGGGQIGGASEDVIALLEDCILIGNEYKELRLEQYGAGSFEHIIADGDVERVIKQFGNEMAEWYPKRSLPSLRIPQIPQSVRALSYRRPNVQSPKYKSGRPVYTRSSPVPDITTKFHNGINHAIFSNKRGKLRRTLIIKTLNNARRAARNFTLLQRRERPAAPAGQVGPVRPIPASADVENLLPVYGKPGESPAAASAMSLSLIPHVQLLPTNHKTRKELNEENELWGSLVRPAQPWRLGGKRTAKHRKRNKTKKNKR